MDIKKKTGLPPHVGNGSLHCPFAKHSTVLLPCIKWLRLRQVKVSFCPFFSPLSCMCDVILTLSDILVTLHSSVLKKTVF